jgi:hypothetical protein
VNTLRIAYFTHDSISEGVGRSQILALCKSLSDSGIEVNLFSFEKNQIDNKLRELTSSKTLVWNPFEFDQVRRLAPLDRINALRRVKGDFDLIHARGDLPALAAVLRKQEPVLWDIRSLWAEQRQVLNPRKFNPVTLWSMHRVTDFISKRVSSYNTLTHSIRPYLKEVLPYLPDLNSTISTCVDTNFFFYKNTLPQRPKALLSGTYNKIYDEFLIREFNSYMKSEYKHDVIWARGKEVKSKAQDLGQSQVFTLTYDAMPSMIADSSYGIAICKNNLGPSLSAAMPTKIAEFLSVGRPVVVNSDLGDVERLLIDKGVAVPLNNVTGITKAAKKLIGLLEDPHTPARCRIIAEEALSLKSATDAYTSLYRAMLRKH